MRTYQNAVAVVEYLSPKREQEASRPRWWASARGDLVGLPALLEKFHHAEAGQDLLEYALLLGIVAATALAGSSSLASVVSSAVAKIIAKIQNAIS